jgi:hypothetical protein
MTTHSWGEKAAGLWKLEIFFSNDAQETTGEFLDWVLLLHGTKEEPYKAQNPTDQNTKLAVSKKIHANNFKDKDTFMEVLKLDHQKRVGDINDIELYNKLKKASEDSMTNEE